MSPAAEVFFLGAQSDRVTRLVWIRRTDEQLTQQTFERLAKALKVPLLSQEMPCSATTAG